MSLQRKYDGDEPQRVNKFMGQSGLCSRREAEALIEKGLVEIDGVRISSPGHKIVPGQTLTLNAKTAASLESKFTAIIHKPEGIVSAQPEDGQIPAARLLTKANLIGSGAPPKKTASLPA
jgi:23S rRNA pseudouridine2604 synthase